MHTHALAQAPDLTEIALARPASGATRRAQRAAGKRSEEGPNASRAKRGAQRGEAERSHGGPPAASAKRAQRGEAERTSSQAGFTLIEIMAVVLIIGLLVGIVGYNVFSQVDTARVSSTRTQIKQLEGALEFYRLDNARYPTTEQGIDALVRKPSGEPQPRNYRPEGYVHGGRVPDDAWGNAFQYQSPGTHNPYSFDLWSLGADGSPGGEGNDADIGNWSDDAQASR